WLPPPWRKTVQHSSTAQRSSGNGELEKASPLTSTKQNCSTSHVEPTIPTPHALFAPLKAHTQSHLPLLAVQRAG
ncbi:uncharacterized protein ASPGLDRAFT_44742, partial [Aspergillus glaucus CBS 516.65]